jgi:hypothetical protein
MIFHFGYIDPGTGSILIQGLIGGLLGVAYMGRKFFAQLAGSVRAALPGQSKNQDSKNLEASDKR